MATATYSHLISFEPAGQPFMAMGAGPLCKFNPSVSFTIAIAALERAFAEGHY